MRFITSLTVILSAISADSAAGSVAISQSGYVQTIVGAATSTAQQTAHDSDEFTGAPVTLNASASAAVSDIYASASIARRISAEWTSPDDFTVDIGFATSLYKQDGISTFIRFNSNDLGAEYTFIATTDAVLTASVVTSSFGTREASFWNDFIFTEDGSSRSIFQRGQDFTFTQSLTAGKTYFISALTELRGDSVFDLPGVDRTLLGNSHFIFNIAAAPTTPGGSAAPEPASWAMTTVGFAAIGAAIRRRIAFRPVGAPRSR